jgi:glycosyltransferase involved in cell wall biosynthesis
MKRPLITVLMPARNAARFIPFSIESVLAQTLPDFELLIINDASSDDTEHEISRQNDARIRLLTNPVRLGLVKTLNRGIQEARGKYIARLDADDLSYPSRFAEQVNVLESDSNVGLVSTWTEVIDENDRTLSFGMWRLSPEAIYYVLHFRQCLTHSSAMFRTELVRGLGGYSEAAVKTEDFDLWYRLSKVSKIVQLPKVLTKWRQHDASITATATAEMERNAFRLAKEHLCESGAERWPSQVVKAFIECASLPELEPNLLKSFPDDLSRIQAAIISSAPQIYDRSELRTYAEVEAVKYAFILRQLGVPFRLSVPARTRLLGFFYYLTCYQHIPLIWRLAPKSHF